MKNKGLLTPSPPVVRIALVLFVLILSLTFFTPTVLAQGPDNLVRLAPGSWAYKVASLIQATDPDMSWNKNASWEFASNYDKTLFVFRAYDKNCALEVVAIIEGRAETGVVYLGDFTPTFDQKNRLTATISAHLFLYRLDWGEQAKVYNCLLKWDRQTYSQAAFDFYFDAGEKVTTCQEKIFYYGKVAALRPDSMAKPLLAAAENAQASIGNDCQKINSQNYKATMAVLILASVTPLPTFTVTPLPTSTFLPSTVIPLATTTMPSPSATATTPRVVSTATAASVASPAATLVVVAPLPVKPGEKSGLDKFFEALIKILALMSCLAIFAIACIIGGGYLIRHIQEVQAKEKLLRAEFAQQQRERLAEGKTKLEGLLARAKELLGSDEQAVLSETAREELNELLYVKIPPLLIFHEQGLAVGQCEFNAILARFRKQRRKK